MMVNPLISVLMPVYNGEHYLRSAIKSILDQTYSNFEFIIVNDGSTDRTSEILESIVDDRIKILENHQNLGLSISLNKAASLARGEYIARMDADDITFIDRFRKQVAFLETHTEVGILGGGIRGIDERGKLLSLVSIPPQESIAIKWRMFFQNPMKHPTIMMRRDLFQLVGGYATEIQYSQDYDLWRRLSIITKLANLPRVIHYQRIHPLRVTVYYVKEQMRMSQTVTQKVISDTLDEKVPLELVQLLREQKDPLGYEEVLHVIDLINKLFKVFYSQQTLSFQERKIIREKASCRIFYFARNYLENSHMLKGVILAWRVAPWFITTRVRQSLLRRVSFSKLVS